MGEWAGEGVGWWWSGLVRTGGKLALLPVHERVGFMAWVRG